VSTGSTRVEIFHEARIRLDYELWHDAVSAVHVLLTRCSPTSVLWGVVAIRVGKAVDAVLWAWFTSLVREKVCVAIRVVTAPAWTNRDAECAVVLVASTIGVVTAVVHALPRPILSRAFFRRELLRV
jgi:hypothetical protein